MKKSYGQHFLQDDSVVQAILDAAAIAPGELVVEVGPGAGALTAQLSLLPNPLILIEADPDLLPRLTKAYPKASILHADAAQVDYDALTTGRPWVFVSNLPYNAGNAILECVLRSNHLPDRLIVMVQKEVGERMMAHPGDMSVLSLATQLYCTVEMIAAVPPNAFVPPPKVDSVVLRLVPRSDRVPDAEAIIQFAKIGFLHRRKQLRQTLAHAGVASIEAIDAALSACGLAKTVRPQELSVEEWVALWRELGE